MANEADRIVPLDQLEDYEVAEGEPDVTGWDVIAADGRKIGEVEQLLVDTAAMKVRYLDVDIEADLVETAEDRHALIPIGFARLHEEESRVLVDNLQSTDVATLPEYRQGPVTREMEESVRERFGRGVEGRAREEGAYEREAYDESRFFGRRRPETVEGETRVTRSEEELTIGKREVQAGQVEIDKDVETQRVHQPVRRRHEEVEIERRPVEEMKGGEARIEEEERHVPLTEEELVVEKRPVVKEELVVRKHPVEETEDVEADVRKERLEVHEHGRVEQEAERGRERGREQQGRERGR